MKRTTGTLLAAGLAATLLPAPVAQADVVRQSANGVEVVRRPGSAAPPEVKGYGYRRQLVDISNCYLQSDEDAVGGDGFWALHTNLSTGVQGYANDYFLGGRCAR